MAALKILLAALVISSLKDCLIFTAVFSKLICDMRAIHKIILSLIFFSLAGFASQTAPSEKYIVYYGTSDASAAVAVTNDLFIVADDENNILRVYKTGQPGLPLFTYDLTEFLEIESEYPEADIEGATILGDYIYWLTSHGRNQDGKIRPNRYRFFATKADVRDGNVTITPAGVPCKTLVHHLLKAENMRQLGLDKATCFDDAALTKQQRKKLAPKQEGLNIEALCASSDSNTIYIGFRNPRPGSKALVVPLTNPRQVIEKQAPPVFAPPLLWDLNGLGIRSMEYSSFHKAYFIIAGPHNDEPRTRRFGLVQGKPPFALYRWSGENEMPPAFVRKLNMDKYNFSPEALVVFKDSQHLLLLSDDGTLPIDVPDTSQCLPDRLLDDGDCPNKFLADPNKKSFRAAWLTP